MNNIELYNDHFQNFKVRNIPHAQLIIADVPYNCYDEETEVWTTKGWKKYTEICDDDIVLSVNKDTQELEYSGIEQIIVRDCNEKMYHFHSMNLDLMVTEGHRMWAYHSYSTFNGKGERIRKTSRENCIKTPNSLNILYFIPRANYLYYPDSTVDTITIPSCEIKTNGQEHIEPPMVIPLSQWLPFFGLWIADGCTCDTKGDNGRQLYAVSIKQFGERRVQVREMLKNTPFKWHEYAEKDREASNFNIYSKQLWLYLHQFGKSSDKFIPRWLLDLNKPYLKLFWKWYTFGDSAKCGDGLRISTVSKQLIENLQEIALKLGVICQVRSQLSNPNVRSSKLIYGFQYNHDSRNIRFGKPDIIEDYKGKVWCIKLKINSVFLVRRNGIITFCGNCGENAYGSNPSWYVGGDNKNGESELAGKTFFDTDKDFRPAEFMHFCSQMLVKEPKNGLTDEEYEKAEKIGGGKKVKSTAPCMVLFCGFDQLQYFIDLGKRYGFMHYIPLVFRKNYSAQVLKANMKIVGNCEYGLVLYKDRLPKFNNQGKMVFNCIDYPRDNKTPKVHPTQKSVPLLEFLISLFTDAGDVVIDPCAGSGTTLLAAGNLCRRAYGFEIKKDFCKAAREKILPLIAPDIFAQQELADKKAERWKQKDIFDK